MKATRPYVVPVLALAAAALALVGARGLATSSQVPPRSEALFRDGGSAVPTSGAGGQGDAVYEVVTPLLEKVQTARIDMPLRDAGLGVLASHWRKIRAPWASVTGDRRNLVLSLALRTSEAETQWTKVTSAGLWKPDARVWNMNEGSFDSREALVVVGPGSVTFKVDVPRDGALEFAPGTVNQTDGDATFTVRVKDMRGEMHVLPATTMPHDGERTWGADVTIDLAAFAGQSIELELGVKATAAPPEGAAHADAAPLVGLFAHPTLLARRPTEIPYNVLYVVVDALRPDVLATFHDDAEDARAAAARLPPLEAALPKMPGLMPNMDALAQEGVRFVHAYSAASWTRPGTLSMLAGKRSTEMGISAFDWIVPPEVAARFYASDPPLLPLILRRHGVTTRAFVNNYFMTGYAPIGVDMGFERVSDHRYRTHDTDAITDDAVRWLRQHGATRRFFAFCNYNSPHEPFEPPAEMEARLPPPTPAFKDANTRKYAAEAAKDDAAVGVLVNTLRELGVLDRTIVVVTADHGETLSSAHIGYGLEKIPIRFHHATSNYEETTRIPIIVRAPKLAPGIVRARVRNVDLAPTLLELLGVDTPKSMRGTSLVSLAKGGSEANPRVVVSEGRGTRAILHGRYRLLLRDPKARISLDGPAGPYDLGEELFDLDDDPGERHNLAPSRPDVVAELKARLAAEERGAPSADEKSAAPAPAGGVEVGRSGLVHLRFAGGGASHRIAGKLSSRAKLSVGPVNLGAESVRAVDGGVEIAAATLADGVVGFDVRAEDPGADVGWQIWWDDRPLDAASVFVGAYGLADARLVHGILGAAARRAASARAVPYVDAKRDRGLFVARDADGENGGGAELSGEGAEEMGQLLKEWGYAQGSK